MIRPSFTGFITTCHTWKQPKIIRSLRRSIGAGELLSGRLREKWESNTFMIIKAIQLNLKNGSTRTNLLISGSTAGPRVSPALNLRALWEMELILQIIGILYRSEWNVKASSFSSMATVDRMSTTPTSPRCLLVRAMSFAELIRGALAAAKEFRGG